MTTRAWRSVPGVVLMACGGLAFAQGGPLGPIVTPPATRAPLRKAALPAAANVAGKRPVDRILAAVGGTFAGTAGDFDDKSASLDARGIHHARLAQRVNGVPVLGGDAIVHVRSDGSLEGLSDLLLRNVDQHLPSTTPKIASTGAVAAAERAGGCTSCLAPQRAAELFIVPSGEDVKLVYRVELEKVTQGKPSRPVLWIDASTGAVVQQYDNLQTAAGTSTYYGTVTVSSSASGTTQYLEDTTLKVGTFNCGGTTTSVSRSADPDGVWNATNQKALVDVHFGLTNTINFLKSKYGWSGLDGNGGPGNYPAVSSPSTLLVSGAAHYSSNYNNAFWNGSHVTCGDGDGTTFGPLTSLDILGHELGHGVIEFTSGLVYQGESGALNESFADVLGALVERHVFGESADTWKIGEKAFTPGNGTADALRYMNDPHQALSSGLTTDDDPDHYSERYTGTGDNGGVHVNSGIANKAFYLLAKGGTHHKGGSMIGIGADDAGKIWFLAHTSYMTATTTFAGARTATIDAAKSLFGATSSQVTAVGTAWGLVGVGPVPGASAPAGLLANGGFEISASPWVVSGSAFHVGNGSYPLYGTGYAYLGNATSTNGQIEQTITIPSNASTTNLRFGLNVTSAEKPSATDKLFVEVRSTTGALLTTLATFTPANKASVGVYADRGAYSLAPYKGQTVKIVFRSVNDSQRATTFRLDNVRID